MSKVSSLGNLRSAVDYFTRVGDSHTDTDVERRWKALFRRRAETATHAARRLAATFRDEEGGDACFSADGKSAKGFGTNKTNRGTAQRPRGRARRNLDRERALARRLDA